MTFKKKTYIKKEPKNHWYHQINWGFYFKNKAVSIFLVFIGSFLMISQVALPLVWFKTKKESLKPINGSVLGVASGFDDFEFKELSSGSINQKPNSASYPQEFYISIPKLNIERAVVETNSTDLSPDENLGHYKGTALPGEVGTSMIYGHSVLPFFYNPKNYKTIFSTLDKLVPGDEFFVEYGGKKLKYVVENSEVLKPKDVNPLQKLKPDYLGYSTMTLLTCVPPGTKSKRLLVNAVRVD